jgi:hypothetical protein
VAGAGTSCRRWLTVPSIACGAAVRLCVDEQGQPMPRQTLGGIAIVEGVVIEVVRRWALASHFDVPHEPVDGIRCVVQCDGWRVLIAPDDLVVVAP